MVDLELQALIHQDEADAAASLGEPGAIGDGQDGPLRQQVGQLLDTDARLVADDEDLVEGLELAGISDYRPPLVGEEG